MPSAFDYNSDFTNINFREHPELYRVGKGEQGVLLIQPYKSEILPYWKFKTPKDATESSKKILALFKEYKRAKDFAGMDMARNFYKWVIPVHGDMLTINQVKNMTVLCPTIRKGKAVRMEDRNYRKMLMR